MGMFYLIGLMAVFATVGLPAEEETPKQKESAAAIIERVLDEKGVDAAKAEFSLLRAKKEDFSFVEAEFMGLGIKLLKKDRPRDAAVVLEMAAKCFPESVNVCRFLSVSYYRAGDSERSLEVNAKMRSIQDEARLAAFLKENENKLAATAEGVIEKHIEATGGREAWQAIKTMVVIFSVQSTAGEQTRLVRMYKRPYYYRQGPENSDRFTATDGESVWSVKGDNWTDLGESGASYIRFASIDNWFIDYAAKGISYTLIGLEYLNGSPVYHLCRTFWDGFQQDLFFSATTNLLTENRSDYIQILPFMKSYMSYWNYREVEGIKIPLVFIRNVGSLGPPHGGLVEEVKINVPLDDALFVPSVSPRFTSSR
jgi:hypothetical protein